MNLRKLIKNNIDEGKIKKTLKNIIYYNYF